MFHAPLIPFAARRFAAGKHSRKEITAAALEFVEEQLSARPIGKVHWDEVTFMLTVFNTHGEDDEALFASVQAIASRLSSACVVVTSTRCIRLVKASRMISPSSWILMW